MKSNLRSLQQKLSKKVALYTNKTFAQLTTIGCGGKIALVAYPSTVRQLKLCIKLAQKHQVKYLVLGRGSNFLASDDDFCGLVICTSKLNKVRRFATMVWCQCGANTARVATFCAKKGLSGVEFWYCLPASVGGAVAMNAGCFGNETANVVKEVHYLDGTKIKRAKTGKCKFCRRNSIFKNSNLVVLGAKLKLRRSKAQDVVATCKQLMERKRATQPLGQRSFGSAFFNSSGTASRLIDQAGLKNCQIGGAKVSNVHAGFVINIDKATSFDIYLLLLHIKEQVYLQFGEDLELEVQTTGFDDDDLGRLSHSH